MTLLSRIELGNTKLVVGPFSTLGYGAHYPVSAKIPAHSHDQDQLIYPGAGLLTVNTEQGAWVVPPERAVWIPANTIHSVTAVQSVDNRSLFFDTHLGVRQREGCEVVSITPFFHELIMEAYRIRDVGSEEKYGLIVNLLIREIREAHSLPLSLPHPRNRSLAKLCEEYLVNPIVNATIDDWSDRLNMSRRTFTRLFRNELGMSFAEWRQQACLFSALPWLASGQSVTSVAFELGYSSTAAFTTMFKRVLGRAPTQYFV